VKGQNWLAKCPKEHVMAALPGSELESLIIDSSIISRIDAFTIDKDDCPMCIQEEHDRIEQIAELCRLAGCPYIDHCQIGTCQALCQIGEIEPSRFANMVNPLPFGRLDSFSEIIPGVTFNGRPVFNF
jgi:hypothetical protein